MVDNSVAHFDRKKRHHKLMLYWDEDASPENNRMLMLTNGLTPGKL